jgi:HAMP domain-containing protein
MGLIEFVLSALVIVLVPAHWLATRRRASATQRELSRLVRNVARLEVAVEAYRPRATSPLARTTRELSEGRHIHAIPESFERHAEAGWAEEKFASPSRYAVRYPSLGESPEYLSRVKDFRLDLGPSYEELSEKLTKQPGALMLNIEYWRLADVESFHRDFPTLPIVCTHRVPDEETWMAALEGGVRDVCPADDVDNILTSVLHKEPAMVTDTKKTQQWWSDYVQPSAYGSGWLPKPGNA